MWEPTCKDKTSAKEAYRERKRGKGVRAARPDGGRKYALPVLYALGKKARASANDPRQPEASLRMGELAKLVGM